MSYLRPLAACLLLCAVSHAQSAPPAPVPAAPAKPNFTLPANTPHTVIQSSGPPPEAPIEDLVCDAPATGIYAPSPTKLTPAQDTALRDYNYLVMQQIFAEWLRHFLIPPANLRLKGWVVEVRFAIMPDGSYAPPIVTASSGHTAWDEHAIAAINIYTNFPTLPAGINHPAVICVHLGYNSDGSLIKPTPPPPPQKKSGNPTTNPFPNPDHPS